MEAQEREVHYYKTTSGASPFREWRSGLTVLDVKAAIDARIARLRQGNFGDSSPIGEGASESRINFGPGFRIYYGVRGQFIIVLCAGDKSSQTVDIKRALDYWNDYKKRIEATEAKRSKEPDTRGTTRRKR